MTTPNIQSGATKIWGQVSTEPKQEDQVKLGAKLYLGPAVVQAQGEGLLEWSLGRLERFLYSKWIPY